MKVCVDIQSQQKYQPLPRCKRLRTRIYYQSVETEVREAESMPVAFLVTEFCTMFPGTDESITSADGTELEVLRFEGNEYCSPFTAVRGRIEREVAFYEGRYYRKARLSDHISYAQGPVRPEDLPRVIRCEGRMIGYDVYPDLPFVEGKSKVIWDSTGEQKMELDGEAESFIVCNGEVWEECGEPGYVCRVCGKDGSCGIELILLEWYGEQAPYDEWFPADRLDDAMDACRKKADELGVLNVVKWNGSIKVLLPEAVSAKTEVSDD